MPETLLKHTVVPVPVGDPKVAFPGSAAVWAQQMHGNGGLFSTPGLENPFISTVIKPKGIGPLLPAYPSNQTSPLYSFITGIDADAGWPADGILDIEICGNAPGGFIANGHLTATFGRLQAGTKTIDLGSISQVLNNSERTDLMLMGGLLPQEQAGLGYAANVNESNVLNNVIQSEMVAASWVLSYQFGKMTWAGNPASKKKDGYIPFNGLERLVKTGHVDAIGGNAMPVVDSLIVDAANAKVDAYAISQQLRSIFAYLNDKAESTVDGATFVLVMRPKMWEALSDVWSQKYVNEWTSLIASGAGAGTGAASETASRVVLDAASLTAQRDALKASMTLPIGGKLYPVILDNGMTEVTGSGTSGVAAGSYSSSIFILPLTVGPGMPVLYWEYMDWNQSLAFAQQAGISDSLIFWTDGGRFVWTLDQSKMCIKLQTRTEPRLVLRTPQFAARIDNLVYAPLHPFGVPTLGAGGGSTTRPPALTLTP